MLVEMWRLTSKDCVAHWAKHESNLATHLKFLQSHSSYVLPHIPVLFPHAFLVCMHRTVAEYTQCRWLDVQLQCQLQVEPWVKGAQGKRPWAGAYPLYNKGHRDLWTCGVSRRPWPQTFMHLDTVGIKTQAFYCSESLSKVPSLSCCFVVAPWFH